jgi:hypothetical protein
MKAKRLLWAVVALFATFSMTVALSSCDKDNEPSAAGNTVIPEGGDSTGDEEEGDAGLTEGELIDLLAAVDAPGAGKIRFAVGVPGDIACNGLGFEGAWNGWSASEPMKGEYVDGLYIFDFDTMPQSTFGSSKFLLLKADGTSDWAYQALTEGYQLQDEYVTLVEDQGQQALNLTADDLNNVVIKIIITAFEKQPACGEVVNIPGGTAKFIFTMEGDCPAENVILTGNFEEKAWGESDREMTKQEDGTYVWEGTYPENFEYKAIAIVGGEQVWLDGGNVSVTGEEGSEISFTGCFQGYCQVEEEQNPEQE